MTKRNYAIGFWAVILAAIALNGFLTYFRMNSRDHVSADRFVMSSALRFEAEQILAGAEKRGYPETIRSLEEQISRMIQYQMIYQETGGGRYSTPSLESRFTSEQVAEYLDHYSYTGSEATARIGMLEYCLARLKKAVGYPDYVKKVTAEAETLAATKLYDDAAKRRIIRTGNRFLGFENIRVSAESEFGVDLLLQASPWNWMIVIMACACAFLYYLRAHAGVDGAAVFRDRMGLYLLACVLGCVVLCVTGAYVSHRVTGLGNLHRAVQSLDDFYSCPYMISVGTLLALSIGGKALACGFLYLFLVGLLFCRRRRTAVLLAGAALLAEILSVSFGAGIRFDMAFHAERLFRDYVSIPLLGEEVNAGWTLAVLLLGLSAAAYLFAGHQVAAALLREKERQENLYFEEIDHKYTEARYIRHDINNHLTALALLMDEGRMEEARSYLDRIFAQLDEVRLPLKTGSSVLDSILFGKVTAARERGIAVKLEFDTDFADTGISDYDLCSVFSNLLDNAVEACGKLPQKEAAKEREILLRVKKQGQMICVFCENEYGELAREGREFVTLKGDKGAHGLGLKRIRSIAEKYHGSVEIDTENGVFSIAVLFMTDGSSGMC